MVQRPFPAFLIFAFLFSGVVSGQTTVLGTIQSGGLTRDYRLYVPAAYNGTTPVPLLLNLHGYGSNNLEQQYYGNFQTIADTSNFLIVLPNGTIDGLGNRFWNNFGTGALVDDVGFISNLIDSLQATYNIDANRIYSTGMSNGGFMSYELACSLNDRIAAIASVTGSMIESKLNNCNPGRPVPVMEIHGTSDPTVPYDGLPSSTFVPISTLVNTWVAFNHCNPTPVFTPVPDTNTGDGCTAEHYVYSGGDNGSTVEHFKIIGGAHTWPGSFFTIGVTNQDINASKEIWRFFRQYKLDELSPTTSPQTVKASEWSVYPNPASDFLVLQHPQNLAPQIVRVLDADGRLMQIWTPSQTPYKIDTADWENGLYFLQIENEGGAIQGIKVLKTGQ